MAVFVNDTFTDTDGTNLTAHTGETGATWAKQTGVTGDLLITDANRVRGDDASTIAAYYASGVPASAEYDVEGVHRQVTSEGYIGVTGRAVTGEHTHYRAYYHSANGQWELVKVVTGTETLLGSFTQGLSNDTDYAIKLEIRDAAKKVYIDGVERISSADNAITAAGRAGVWAFDATTNTTGRHLASITATDAGVAQKITELAALADPVLTDLLTLVDAPGGTAINKKVTISSLISTFALLTNVVVQVKTVGSGTYTPTSGMKKVLAIGVGGGGAGAGGINTDSAGGGGGGGGTVIRLLTASDIGASKDYVVGAAGAATTLDTAGALLNAGAGGAGTAGATFSVAGVSVAGGAGGTAANGNLNIPGQPGERGVIFSGTVGRGGKGGSSVFGAGGIPGDTNTAGGNGGLYGGGGAGGHASGNPDRDGGAGAEGILYLVEFLS